MDYDNFMTMLDNAGYTKLVGEDVTRQVEDIGPQEYIVEFHETYDFTTDGEARIFNNINIIKIGAGRFGMRLCSASFFFNSKGIMFMHGCENPHIYD